MTLRPRNPGGRVPLAQSRMAPGGRRWSESPIPRPGRRRVRAAGAPAIPLYWWKFDDASGDSAESAGGPSIVWTGDPSVPVYRVTALAPGSTYALDMVDPGVAFATGQATSTTGIPDGPIVIDVWFSGYTATGTTGTYTLLHLRETSTTRGFSIAHNYNAPANLLFKIGNGSTMVTVLDLTAPPDPAHIRWEIDTLLGTSTIIINGTTEDTSTGLTIGWSAGTWTLDVGPGEDSTVIDELKIYGAA